MKSLTRLSLLTGLLVLSLCSAGCEEKKEQLAALLGLSSASGESAAPTGDAGHGAGHGAAMAPAVEAMVVYATDVPWVGDYVAQTAGSREVQVRAQISGILEERTYTEGSIVNKGDLLFQIEDDPYVAAKKQAESNLAQARVTFERADIEHKRILKLFKQGAVSQSDRDDAVAAYGTAAAALKAAEAGLEAANVNLAYTKVNAPLSGISSKESRSEGSLVTVGSDNLLTSITQVDPLYINFGVPYSTEARQRSLMAAGKVGMAPEGLRVELVLADGTSYADFATITFKDSTVDQYSATVKTRAEVANPDVALLPGQFVRAQVHGYYFKNGILIPQRSVLETQNGSMVYVIDAQNIANFRPVSIVESFGNNYLIEGLSSGDKIIVEGIIKARPGQPVTVVKVDDTKPAAASAPAPSADATTAVQKDAEEARIAAKQAAEEAKAAAEAALEAADKAAKAAEAAANKEV